MYPIYEQWTIKSTYLIVSQFYFFYWWVITSYTHILWVLNLRPQFPPYWYTKRMSQLSYNSWSQSEFYHIESNGIHMWNISTTKVMNGESNQGSLPSRPSMILHVFQNRILFWLLMVFHKSKNHAAPFWLSHEIPNKIMVFFFPPKEL